MSIIIDVVLALMFLGIVFFAAKKGFALSVLEVAAFVLAIVLAVQVSAPIAGAIYDGFFENGIEEKIEQSLPNNAEGATYAKKASAVLDSIPSFYASYAKRIGIDVAELSSKITSSDFSNHNIVNQLEEKVAKPIVVSIMKGILFIFLCLALGIIFKACARAINKLFKLPIIGTANKLLGAMFGVLKGAIVIIVICSALTFFAPKTNKEFKTAVDSSKVVSLANDLNPMKLFNK